MIAGKSCFAVELYQFVFLYEGWRVEVKEEARVVTVLRFRCSVNHVGRERWEPESVK